jgi:hypothetical protein
MVAWNDERPEVGKEQWLLAELDKKLFMGILKNKSASLQQSMS